MAHRGKSNRRLYAALAALGLFFAAFHFWGRRTAVADWVVRWVTAPYKRAMGRLCDGVPFSVAEVLVLAAAALAAGYVLHSVHRIGCARGHRLAAAWRALLGAAVMGLGVYAGYTLLWGFNYYATAFEQQAGLEDRPISVEALAATTRFFAQKLNDTAPLVVRDASGCFAEPKSALLARSGTVYNALELRYPFLGTAQVRPKPVLFSRAMSEIRFTGFLFPFTGEANLNVDSPACLLPSTIAHELAHVHGVAAEQTANFVAVLACDTSGDAAYAYSGYLLAYIHLSNALAGADASALNDISATLCDGAKRDLGVNNAYWRQFDSAAARAANTVYSGFLQSYDQKMGLKSYGAVVDLLAAYYGGM